MTLPLVTTPAWNSPEGAPLTPTERLPLIAHRLREAKIVAAELRYEGRGGMGGFILQFYDRHSQQPRTQPLDEHLAQQLTGFLWQRVLERYPDWNHEAGSFGVMSWDMKKDGISHSHHRRRLEVKTFVIEGL